MREARLEYQSLVQQATVSLIAGLFDDVVLASAEERRHSLRIGSRWSQMLTHMPVYDH